MQSTLTKPASNKQDRDKHAFVRRHSNFFRTLMKLGTDSDQHVVTAINDNYLYQKLTYGAVAISMEELLLVCKKLNLSHGDCLELYAAILRDREDYVLKLSDLE